VRAEDPIRSSALVHLYRGELGRMTAYRARLDTTTNWAVGTTAAIVSFTLSNPEAPHFAFIVALVLNVLFMWIEARRYRSYELVRKRVRLMERGFYAQVLGGEVDEGWDQELVESLRRPVPPIDYLQAFSVRLRRNYIWLVVVIYLTWVARLGVDAARPGVSASFFSVRWMLIAGLVTLIPLLYVIRHYRPPEEG
jgi:uncharacterized membrane protein